MDQIYRNTRSHDSPDLGNDTFPPLNSENDIFTQICDDFNEVDQFTQFDQNYPHHIPLSQNHPNSRDFPHVWAGNTTDPQNNATGVQKRNIFGSRQNDYSPPLRGPLSPSFYLVKQQNEKNSGLTSHEKTFKKKNDIIPFNNNDVSFEGVSNNNRSNLIKETTLSSEAAGLKGGINSSSSGLISFNIARPFDTNSVVSSNLKAQNRSIRPQNNNVIVTNNEMKQVSGISGFNNLIFVVRKSGDPVDKMKNPVVKQIPKKNDKTNVSLTIKKFTKKPYTYITNPHIRKNPWGNESYAQIICAAIESSSEKKLTLSEIYDWFIAHNAYFADKRDVEPNKGWKVSCDVICITLYVLKRCKNVLACNEINYLFLITF